MPRMYNLGIANVLGRSAKREFGRMLAGLPASEAVLTCEALLAREERARDVAAVAVQSVLPIPTFDPETDYNIGSTVDFSSDTCRFGVAPGVVLQCSPDAWVDIHTQIV